MIGPPSEALGSAAAEVAPSGRKPRRSPAGRLLLTAWLLLAATFAAAALYVYWPQLAAQVAALSGTAPPDERQADVEVAPATPVPAVQDGAEEAGDPGGAATPPDPTPPPPTTSGLELEGPQSAPLPDLDPAPAAAEPVPGQQPTGPTEAETAPPSGDTQTAALPRVPETAAPVAPAPPAVPAWQRFAQPFTPPDERPLIAVVITGLGLNGPRTLQAIEQLPPEVSLSFSPYAKQAGEFMRTARAFGHEVLVDLPMEPATADDPGTMALLTGLGTDVNLDRLGLVLDRGRSYVGVVGTLGSRFVSDSRALAPVLAELGRRGLLYVDNRPLDTPYAALQAAELGLPVAINDRSLDARLAATPAVDASLAQVERIARERGTAVALGQPNPTTLAFLAEWVKTLPGKGLALAPVTAVADTQPVR